jgi:hypothetical protein
MGHAWGEGALGGRETDREVCLLDNQHKVRTSKEDEKEDVMCLCT